MGFGIAKSAGAQIVYRKTPSPNNPLLLKNMREYIELVIFCLLGMCTVMLMLGAYSMMMDGIETRKEARHRRMIETLKAQGRRHEIA